MIDAREDIYTGALEFEVLFKSVAVRRTKLMKKKELNILRHSLQSLQYSVGVPEALTQVREFHRDRRPEASAKSLGIVKEVEKSGILVRSTGNSLGEGCGYRTQGWCKYTVSILQTEISVLGLACQGRSFCLQGFPLRK